MASGAVSGAEGGSTVSFGIQQLENPFRGGHGSLQNVVLLAQVLDGAEETQSVLQKCHHHSQCQAAGLNAQAAVSQNGRQGQHGNEFHHRIKPAVGRDGVLVCIHVLAVDAVKFLGAAPFAVEELQHYDSGDVLLQVGIDLGDGDADAPVALASRCGETPRW